MTTQTKMPGTGLDGVVAAETRLSRVDGLAGRLTIAGFEVAAFAPRATFEQTVFLLRHDRLPDAGEEAAVARALRDAAQLPEPVLDVLRGAAARGLATMDALRAAVGALDECGADAVIGALAGAVAAYARLSSGEEPVAPAAELGHAANYLRMLRGADPAPAAARALETYLNTVVDHGMNASTFTARVVASTGSDLVSAVTAAIGALKGPLHGGAPGPALASLLRLREVGGDLDARTRDWVRAEVARGERIMGFGHRVYKVRDPRADVLGDAARALLAGTGLYEDAQVYERAVLETLAELKPGRALQTNVEFYTALLLHGVGLDARWFTPTFAVSRVAGWAAHFDEQQRLGRLLRPRAAYVGAEGRTI